MHPANQVRYFCCQLEKALPGSPLRSEQESQRRAIKQPLRPPMWLAFEGPSPASHPLTRTTLPPASLFCMTVQFRYRTGRPAPAGTEIPKEYWQIRVAKGRDHAVH